MLTQSTNSQISFFYLFQHRRSVSQQQVSQRWPPAELGHRLPSPHSQPAHFSAPQCVSVRRCCSNWHERDHRRCRPAQLGT